MKSENKVDRRSWWAFFMVVIIIVAGAVGWFYGPNLIPASKGGCVAVFIIIALVTLVTIEQFMEDVGLLDNCRNQIAMGNGEVKDV